MCSDKKSVELGMSYGHGSISSCTKIPNVGIHSSAWRLLALKDIVWRTSLQVCLLYPWTRRSREGSGTDGSVRSP